MKNNGLTFLSSPIKITIVAGLFCTLIIGGFLHSNYVVNSLYSEQGKIRDTASARQSVNSRTIDLLTEMINESLVKKWIADIENFDHSLNVLTNSVGIRKIAAENKFFANQLSEAVKMWHNTKSNYIGQMKEDLDVYLQAQKLQKYVKGRGPIYMQGYQEALEKGRYVHPETDSLIESAKYLINISDIYSAVILKEMDKVVSQQISHQAATVTYLVFILCALIIFTLIIVVFQTSHGSQKNQSKLEEKLAQQNEQLKAEQLKTEQAKIQTENINKQLQSSVQRANDLARQATDANKAKTDFLTKISHEIRTPMNAIIGFSEVLSEENLKAEHKGYISIIRESGSHLLGLINSILDFSKLESGKITIEKSECKPMSLLKSVEDILRPAAIKKGVKFLINVKGALPATIHTDAVRLKQCLINLVGNAIKFTESGKVIVEVSIENADKEFIRFDVKDSGIGIPEHLQKHIFEPFSQAEGVFRKFGGTGLGLTITKRFVEMLDGDVTIQSQSGIGSTFTLMIPTGTETLRIVSQPNAKEKEIEQVELKIESKSDDTEKIVDYKLSGKVLIAEDSPTNQTLIEILLKKLGLSPTIVENGKLAVKEVQQQDFDVILMDIQMPVMNGYDATRTIKQLGIETPIIALTANAMKDDDQKCYDAGCDAYLAKPVDTHKLADTLEKYLKQSKDKKNEISTTQGNQKMTNENNSQQKVNLDNQLCCVDWSLVMARIGDERLMDEILPVFMKDSTERMKMLADAVSAGDLREVKFYAHSLKGASATVGAVQVSEIARDLEIAGREQNAQQCTDLFAQLKHVFGELQIFVGKPDWKKISKDQAKAKGTIK